MSNANNPQLEQKLRRAAALIEECLQEIASAPAGRPAKGASKAASLPVSLPEHLAVLRDEGFFRQPQTPKEVHAKLQPVYHCELDRVVVALLRLLKRKELRKTYKEVDGKKLVAYVF